VREIDQSPSDLADAVHLLIIRHALASGDRFGLHDHPQAQLSWTPTGVLSAEVGDRHWTLPPTVGLLIPGGVPHDVHALRDGEFYGIYFRVSPPLIAGGQPLVVAMTPIMQALISHLALARLTRNQRGRAEAVLLDNLGAANETVIALPMPMDPRARAITRALIADPADNRTLEEWGQAVGASRRTLVRLFDTETNLGFLQWRSQLRVSVASVLLANGSSVQAAARSVGYHDPSAFIDAFRKLLGTTPGAYNSTRAAVAGERSDTATR